MNHRGQPSLWNEITSTTTDNINTNGGKNSWEVVIGHCLDWLIFDEGGGLQPCLNGYWINVTKGILKIVSIRIIILWIFTTASQFLCVFCWNRRLWRWSAPVTVAVHRQVRLNPRLMFISKSVEKYSGSGCMFWKETTWRLDIISPADLQQRMFSIVDQWFGLRFHRLRYDPNLILQLA